MNRFASVVVAASLALGCSRTPELAAPAPSARREAPAERILALDDLVTVREVLRFAFHDPSRSGETPLEPGRPVRLEPAVRLEGDAADLLELELTGLAAPGAIEAHWSVVGATPATRFRRSASGRDAVGHAIQLLRIPLGGSSDWRGAIERLELRYSGPRNAVPTLRSARIVRAEVDPERLARTRGRRFHVELDHELREASILAAGAVWREELQGSGADRLRLASGIMSGSPAELEVRIDALDRSGTVIARSATRVARSSGVGAWDERSVPLTVPAETWRIRAEIEPLVEAGDRSTLVALAEVELVATAAAAPAAPNVILVSVDTLRADRVGSYAGRADLTPRIDAWSRRRAVQFDSAWSAAASTLPSHASMLTGLDPLRHGAYLEVPLGPAAVTLAERLAAVGYDTVAFTGGGYLHPHYGFVQGFRRYRYWPRPPGGRSSDLASSIDAALGYLSSERTRPFLLFLHTYDVHGPFRRRTPPGAESFRVEPRSRGATATQGYFDGDRWPLVVDAGIRRELRRDEVALVSELYDHGVRAVDTGLGRLLDGLRSLGLEESTVVVLTSDHGESLGEHDFWGHGYLWATNLRVPLLISVPGRTRGGERSAEPVSLYDLVPTVLDLAGLAPPTDLEGRSLVPRLGESRPDAEAASGRVLWAYAPDTNHGVAAMAGAEKLVLGDAPFPGSPTAESWLTLEDRPVESTRGRDDRRLELRRAALARIAGADGGILLRLENRGGAPARLVLRSPAFRPNAIKRVSPPDLEVRFLEPDGLQLGLPARADWTLRILGPERELAVEVEAETGGSAAGRGRLVASAAELCASVRQATWSPGATPAVVVSARGNGECAVEGLAAPNPELREQLLGLGYLN